jgi:hypothetical protein
MRELLKANRDELQDKLNFKGVREKSDIFITEHENIISAKAQPPCIGIAAGDETREELAGSQMRYTRQVHVVAWMRLLQKEEAIAGDDGLLALSAGIDTLLDENLLSITGMESAFCRKKGKPEVFGTGRDALQRQILTIEYQQTGPRP